MDYVLLLGTFQSVSIPEIFIIVISNRFMRYALCGERMIGRGGLDLDYREILWSGRVKIVLIKSQNRENTQIIGKSKKSR
jgi:hypothetical protein